MNREALFETKHVRITVVSLKRHLIPHAKDDAVYLGEPGEVFSVYLRKDHKDIGLLTGWFSSYVDAAEGENRIAFGAIKRIEEFRKIPNAKFYITKLGRFIVEE